MALGSSLRARIWYQDTLDIYLNGSCLGSLFLPSSVWIYPTNLPSSLDRSAIPTLPSANGDTFKQAPSNLLLLFLFLHLHSGPLPTAEARKLDCRPGRKKPPASIHTGKYSSVDINLSMWQSGLLASDVLPVPHTLPGTRTHPKSMPTHQHHQQVLSLLPPDFPNIDIPTG